MMQRLIKFFARLISPAYLVVSMLIMLGVIASLLYKPLTEFQTTDPQPGIMQRMPQKKAEGAETAVPVTVGMLILNFPEFDIIENKFIADLTLWFEFDPSLITLETVEKFSFDRGAILKKTEADMKVRGKKLFVQYGIRLGFSSASDHKLFPLNDHRLFITLKNEYVTPHELLFIAPRSSFLIGPNAQAADWLLIDRSTRSGYVQAALDEFDTTKAVFYPAIVFSIDLAKKGIRKIFIVMLPMFILFMIASFTLLMNPDPLARSILSLSTGTLTGLIAYRFVIERVVPNVGYFTLTDHIYNLFLTIIFLIFIVNMLAVTLKRNDVVIKAVKGGTLLFAQLALIASFYYLLRI